MKPAGTSEWDAVVIGGGFYGACLALFLRERFPRVLLVEKEPDLLTRASYANQARIHNGYHYPRSFLTALRSAANFPRFVADFRDCVDSRFLKVYAISRRLSKVNARQFEQFCGNIGAPAKRATEAVRRLFDPNLVEDVFQVEECAFDAAGLRAILRDRLERSGIEIRENTEAERVTQAPGGMLRVELRGGGSIAARHVFNCTYSRINPMLEASGVEALPLKHEVAEIALIEAPEPLRRLGVTVMDGPFFSTMPFPAEGLHSLSHVRYTPHSSWTDSGGGAHDPEKAIERPSRESQFPYMLRDARRYLPCLSGAVYVRSLFEVKSVLLSRESDDGRPILVRRHPELGSFWSVMGGKVDNIYDVLAAFAGMSEFSSTAS